ncbi:MAG TPA: hypothetical protein VGQ44_17495, partial [Gemmatimonadaceae bacterium]|nr:hypothetical protein [Gemmatimonadaceae bacterium]
SFYRFDRHETRVARRQELRALGASSHHEAIARALAGEHWTVISLAMAEPPHAPAPSKFQSRVAPSNETAPVHVVHVPPVNRFPLAPLVRLADATGGDVATDAQNAARELRELSDRIVITYQTERPADDTLRQIEVTSRRPGVTIRASKWAGNLTAGAVAESLASSLATETATSDDATASGTLPLTCSITLGPVVKGVSTSEVQAHVDLKPLGDLVAPDEQGSLTFTVAVITPNEPPFTTTRRMEHVDLAAPAGYTCTLGIRHRRNARIAVVATEPSTGSWGTCVVDGATLH